MQACVNKAITIDTSGNHRFERRLCQRCGRCADACPTGALEKIGTLVSVEEVLAEVVRDRVFYEESGGGMTLSGGEPLLQYEFSLQLLQQAKAGGLHTCLETCGFGKTEELLFLASFTDTVLFDWKESDPVLHKKWTGVVNTPVHANLMALDRQGANIILRCPIVPGINLRKDHLEGIAALASTLSNCQAIHLMNYHGYGLSKYKRLGLPIPPAVTETDSASSDEMDAAILWLTKEWKGKIEVY